MNTVPLMHAKLSKLIELYKFLKKKDLAQIAKEENPLSLPEQ